MSILSTTDLSFFTGAAADLFNQASSFHTLIVHKKPTKTLVNINTDSYNGYNNEDNPSVPLLTSKDKTILGLTLNDLTSGTFNTFPL